MASLGICGTSLEKGKAQVLKGKRTCSAGIVTVNSRVCSKYRRLKMEMVKG